MRRITCRPEKNIIFEKGFDEFIQFCKESNFRKDSINHYKSNYRIIEKIVPYNTPISDITAQTYKDYISYLQHKKLKEITIWTYLKAFKRIVNFFIEKGYCSSFEMKLPKVDSKPVETYSDEELKKLLRKPNLKTCIFTEFRDWVMINFLLSTGVRLSSLANIRIADIDFENKCVNIIHTKNRKALIIPLNNQIISILKEYLYQRGGENDEILFCTIWGKPLNRHSVGIAIRNYNNRRGVTTTGIHRFRHTFAKKWILNGGSVVALQKILGHSSLDMTQKYINLLVTDLNKEVDNCNILKEFSNNYIKMENRTK